MVSRAANDQAVTRDPRTLHALRAFEKSCPGFSCLDGVQQGVKPNARRLLTSWMLQVTIMSRM